MGNSSADPFFPRTSRTQSRPASGLRSRPVKAKMPSSTGYLVGAILAAVLLFLLLWWLLVTSGDEAPWLPAGLITVVFLVVALSAREVLMRRAWTRYLLEHGIKPQTGSHSNQPAQKKTFSVSLHSAALRAIQKQSAAADLPSSTPDAHLDVALLCQDFLAGTDEVLRSGNFGSEKGVALKSGQERVRALHKHHLLIWARDQSRVLTHEAQHKGRTSDKIETANKALECIDSALLMYPDEIELNESRNAIGEFIASVRVAHWVELAERSTFKGHYRRAIDRYKDALFYLNDDAVKDEVRAAGAARIEHEIEGLRERLRAAKIEKEENRKDN